jgi:hypothetical protein
MIKKILPLIFIFGLISCNNETESIDYFGQTPPDTIPVIFAPGTISIEGRLENGLSFSPDGMELAFGVLLPDSSYKGSIYYSKRNNNTWSEIVEPDFIGEGSFYLPYFTPNGKSMLFAKSSPNYKIYDYTDIWIVTKQNGEYANPVRLNAPVSSFTRDANASMTMDGTIYLASNRGCPDGQCFANIYCSRQLNGEYIECNMVENVSSQQVDEESVFISPNEDYIITCRYTNTTTWMDLYISYRNHENKWMEPQIIDSSINSTLWDRSPFVSVDNNYLFYTSSHKGEKGLTESDIYWVITSKLFKPYVYNPLSDTTVQVGVKFEIPIPLDYFKDIDDKQLTLRINQNEYSWLEFDRENMKITGLPTVDGVYDLTFIAIDKSSNKTEDKIKITVM